jgi:hypothetical protein
MTGNNRLLYFQSAGVPVDPKVCATDPTNVFPKQDCPSEPGKPVRFRLNSTVTVALKLSSSRNVNITFARTRARPDAVPA